MITYDYYRIFYYVAQYKSFTKAARALHNNQPNITRCMNNLEQELKCTLFLRSNKGIALTPEGRQLYEHVALAFEQLSIGEEEIRQSVFHFVFLQNVKLTFHQYIPFAFKCQVNFPFLH